MPETNGWLRLGCILVGGVIMGCLDQVGPWGHSMALGVGAIGIGNALAVDATRWWHTRS